MEFKNNECGPFRTYEESYDPRGSGADHDVLVCIKCGGERGFRVSYREDYYSKKDKAKELMVSGCGGSKATTPEYDKLAKEYHKNLLSNFWGDNGT